MRRSVNLCYRSPGGNIVDLTKTSLPEPGAADVLTVNTRFGHVTLAAIDVGLENADNTSDLTKSLTGNPIGDRIDLNASNLSTHAANALNPHMVTAAQVGLGNVDNTTDLEKPISTLTQAELDTKINSVVAGNNVVVDILDPFNPIVNVTDMRYDDTDVLAHIANITTNPHAVDKADVGLGNVDNTSDLAKPISTATQTALDGKVDDSQVLTDVPIGAVFTDTTNHTALSNIGLKTHLEIDTHLGDVLTNPHAITKTTIGLSNVDNTSDANKPISTATQSALDLKIDLTEKASPLGVATLDALGIVPLSQLPPFPSPATLDSIVEIHVDTAEPTGFLNRVDSVISFTELTQTFTIAPVVTDYSIYIHGIKYTIAAQLDLVISNVTGMHFIYIDALGGINEITAFDPDIILKDNAYVASVYWNAETSEIIYVGDERHGITMDWATHTHFHLGFGAQYVEGFGLSNMIVDANGDLDIHAQLAVGNGLFKDEDLSHSIVSGVLQTLTPVAQIPIVYREGINGAFRILPPTSYIIHPSGTGRASYNDWNGITWGIAEGVNNDFVLAHIVATNDITHPMMVVMGTTGYQNKTAAQLGANDEISNLGALPYEEIIPIATVIFKTADSFANAVKSTVFSTDDGADYIDWRTVQINPSTTLGDHNVLAGRSSLDAHPTSSITGLDTALAGLQSIRGVSTTTVDALMSVLNYAIFADATAGAITITLPSAVGIAGLKFAIKKVNVTGGEVTIVPDGIETIDNSSNAILTGYNSATIISDGSKWYII